MQKNIDTGLLAKYKPLNRLSHNALSVVTNVTHIFSFNSDQNIPFISPKESLFYLIKGQVELHKTNTTPIKVAAGSKRALSPLCTDTHIYEFMTTLDTAYVAVIDRKTLNEIIETESASSSNKHIEVSEETDLDTQQNQLLIKLYTAYEQDALELPSMPEVALKLRDATQDPDVTIDQLVSIVQADAAIAGSLLHAANGPLFCSAGPVKNLRYAVVRLGVATTQSLATAVGLFKAFYAQNPTLKKRINQAWQDSLTVSALAYVLAKQVRGLDPDRALLAGLLHRVGSISILGYLDAHGLTGTDEEVDAAINVLSGPVGILVMNYWEMGEDLTNVVEEINVWNREVEKADYCDVVQVAWLHHAINDSRYDTLPDINTIPAKDRLGLNKPIKEILEGYEDGVLGMASFTSAV